MGERMGTHGCVGCSFFSNLMRVVRVLAGPFVTILSSKPSSEIPPKSFQYGPGLRISKLTACRISRIRASKSMFSFSQLELSYGLSGSAEIGKPHFGVFAGEQHTRRPRAKCGQHGLLDRLLGCLAVISFSGDADIDAWPDLGMRSGHALQRAFGLAVDVVGRKPRVGNLVIAALFEIHDRVVELQQALLRKIAIECRTDRSEERRV